MKQKLITMLELQDAMNSKVNADWRNAGNEWYRAIWIEASEMLEHYGWKWWKKQDPDMMQAKLEVVDIVHFALSICLESEANSELDTIAAAIEVGFENPEKTADIRTTIELLAKETLINQGAHFSIIAGVMEHLDMSFDELYRIYVGKNVLNMFRQDHGYKEGTYRKMWAGREDNEYLADILESLDSNKSTFKDDVYTALGSHYAEAA
jgi:dimeric dUTPase (all-alpha-NTP-PPase superfamily)